MYSDTDADALHVCVADEAVRIGGAAAADSYLHADRIVAAAVATGVDAVHPGYGFLSERPELARACAAAGVVFVGPPVAAIEAMGDKARARALMQAAGVPVVAGTDDGDLDDDALVDAAGRIGLPVMVKPVAGGGGTGMVVVREPAQLRDALATARRRAAAAFGDERLLLERFVTEPRHVEVQVLADAHGNTRHLGERECSLQRRHQKIVEESPSPLLDDATRDRLTASATEAARACGYRGAGTVEYLVSAAEPDRFHFLEMNTRLQVEHPVTELRTGIDLVEWQLRVAAGQVLPWSQEQITFTGHAVEARINAEDPARGFLPTGGTVLALASPSGEGVRVDAGIATGSTVPAEYDSLVAKVVTHGADRRQALRRLEHALGATAVLGLHTNVGFVRRVVGHHDVRTGQIDTGWVERHVDELLAGSPPNDVLAAAALGVHVGAGRAHHWSQCVRPGRRLARRRARLDPVAAGSRRAVGDGTRPRSGQRRGGRGRRPGRNGRRGRGDGRRRRGDGRRRLIGRRIRDAGRLRPAGGPRRTVPALHLRRRRRHGVDWGGRRRLGAAQRDGGPRG